MQSIQTLLSPLITLETLKVHPIRELNELCQKENYIMEKTMSCTNVVTFIRIDLHTNGLIHKYTYAGSAGMKKAKKVASSKILKSLHETI